VSADPGPRAKTLIFVCGPNGVGKSTTCRRLNERLPYSARVDSDWCRCVNPWEFSEELIELNVMNLTALLGNYLRCGYVRYVIFPYGLHGPRKRIFDRTMAALADIGHHFVPVLLTCETDENVRRMQQDGRDPRRIERALEARGVYEGLRYPAIDTTHLSVDEVVDRVLELL